MLDPEQLSVEIDVTTLHKPEENLPLPDLAKRLSEAIIETVKKHKAQDWELVKMDFHTDGVKIDFKRKMKR